ncbi:unnamed protein product [Camellia sinensis]
MTEEKMAAATEELVEILIQDSDFLETARLKRKYPGKSPNQERPIHSTTIKFIFSDQYFVDYFGKLTITDISGSIEMWHNQLEVVRLDKVRFMFVQCCGKLSNVISSNLMQRLQYLQRLKVWWCDSLESIFDLQGSVCAATTSEEGTSITWFEDLKFMYLPKLMHIWTNVFQRTYSFENLKSLEVERCDNLRYIFTISMVKVLVRLNYLRIGNCEKVENIVTREEEEEEENDDNDEDDDDDNDDEDDDNEEDEDDDNNDNEDDDDDDEDDDDDDNEDDDDDDDDGRGKINIFSVELENLPSLVCIGIPESQIRIFKLRVDFCPKYREVMMWKASNITISCGGSPISSLFARYVFLKKEVEETDIGPIYEETKATR